MREFRDQARSLEAQVPAVSIGLPVHNGGEFVRKAVESLLAQTFTHFELIISDNASTDNTSEICQEFAARDSRIRYVRQPQNEGAMTNFRFVLDAAAAHYFMWAAADDTWHEDYISRCIAGFEQGDDIGVVFTKYWIVSRMYPPLKMRYIPDMDYLSTYDPFHRVSNYILMEELSHKANVIYGLWNKSVAKSMMDAFVDIESSLAHCGLDIAQIVFTLSHWRAIQVPEVLFFKTYKRLPPGHFLDVILSAAAAIKKDRERIRIQKEIATEAYINLLRESLRRADVYDSQFEEILSIKRTREVEVNTSAYLSRRLLMAVRAGLI